MNVVFDFIARHTTDLIAIYAAFVATGTFIFSIWLNHNRTTTRLKIKANIAQFNFGFSWGESHLAFTALNISPMPIHITCVGFYKGRQRIVLFQPLIIKLPSTVNPNRTISAYFPLKKYSEFHKIHNPAGFFFEDETGKIWKYKATKKELTNWQRG